MLNINRRTQSEKAVYHVIPTVWHYGKGTIFETKD